MLIYLRCARQGTRYFCLEAASQEDAKKENVLWREPERRIMGNL